MEKLIKLLNEYEKINMCRKFDSFELHTFEDSKGLVDRILEDTVISRRYGFIKRLVDNDKIDLGKVKNIKLPVDTNLRARVDKDEKTCFNRLYTLKLLMLLAISENPISDLISYLK